MKKERSRGGQSHMGIGVYIKRVGKERGEQRETGVEKQRGTAE